ncbi:MAG: 16S rRNA (guanine(966)-N(2))-methyltransferase RsmD [Candidatus Tectomicrobia bacterium]|nr:16S rRNA (guanine(966)-N(2))-methyltransferase RsmD [Candidatus Tectomicrobia bacterium]
MRVIAGSARGRTLQAPRGLRVRPTAARARESLFGILGAAVEAARVLDLYAGVGCLGIEALSRGAAHVTFVEFEAAAARLLRRNLAHCGFPEARGAPPQEAAAAGPRARLLVQPVARALRWLARRGEGFDVVLADPPYGAREHGALLAALGGGSLLRRGGLVILEHHRKLEVPASAGRLRLRWQRDVGGTRFTAYGDDPAAAEEGSPCRTRN